MGNTWDNESGTELNWNELHPNHSSAKLSFLAHVRVLGCIPRTPASVHSHGINKLLKTHHPIGRPNSQLQLLIHIYSFTDLIPPPTPKMTTINYNSGRLNVVNLGNPRRVSTIRLQRLHEAPPRSCHLILLSFKHRSSSSNGEKTTNGFKVTWKLTSSEGKASGQHLSTCFAAMNTLPCLPQAWALLCCDASET